jgi:Ca2+-binding RTX toxin-like protein
MTFSSNGNEFRVNTTTTGAQITYNPIPASPAQLPTEAQSFKTVAMGADGSFVVVWSSQGQDDPTKPLEWGVYAQRYNSLGQPLDRDGNPIGEGLSGDPTKAEILVNSSLTKGQQLAPAVAMDANGDFVVTWSSYFFDDPNDYLGYAVYAQRYNKDGTVKDSNPILVNTTTVNDQKNSSIAMQADGSFIITWAGVIGNQTNIYAQRFGSDGSKLGGETLVNTYTSNNQQSATVAVDSLGRFVVVWESENKNDDESWGIYARVYGADGNALSEEFQVHQSTTGAQRHPSVAIDAAGNFVVSWTSSHQGSPDIYTRRFSIDADAPEGYIARGDETRVNVLTLENQQSSSVVMNGDGSYIVTWTSDTGEGVGGGNGVYARRFAADGTPLASEARINNYTLGSQAYSSVAVDGAGNFIVAWTSEGQDGSGNGVYARRYTTDPIPNDAPTNISLSQQSIDENVGDNFEIGTLTTTDPNVGDTHTYNLVNGFGDNAAFTIVGNKLRINESPDFETKSSYEIRIRTTDNKGASFEKTFTIEVKDINEAPTKILLSNTAIDENVPANTPVGILTTQDPDAGDAHTYTLVNGFGDNNQFEIVFVAGEGYQLIAKFSPDYETKDTYSVKVRSTDKGGLFYDETFTININNVNEAPTNVTLNPGSVDENSAIGVSVGTFTTIDPDGDTQFTYELINGAVDNSLFTISGNELRVNAAFDYEAKNEYIIQVKVTDLGGKSFIKDLTVRIDDVNEAPTALFISETEINEGIPSGSAIAVLTTEDPDAGDTHFYTIDAAFEDGNLFEIKNGNQLVINESPNATTNPEYTIRVRTTDSKGLFKDEVFTIIVNPLDPGTPTSLSLSNQTIKENAANLEIGTFITEDSDQTEGHSYSFVSGFPDNNFFEIIDGKLFIKQSPNYEARNLYQIRIRVTDENGNFLDQDFEIIIEDVNEPPTVLDLDNQAIEEKIGTNQTVGKFSTNDPDIGEITEYILVDGFQDNSRFKIENDELILLESPDAAVQSEYKIKVLARDSAGNEIEREFTIAVTNINEAPFGITLDPDEVNTGLPAGSKIGIFTTQDPDLGDTHEYTIDSAYEDGSLFTIVDNELILNQPTNVATKPEYKIRITTTDKAGLSFSREFTIKVNDVDTPPSNLELSNLSVAENVGDNFPIADITSFDPNIGDSVTYSLVENFGDNAAFTIVEQDGAFRLVINQSPDFEAKPTYSIKIRATDSKGLFTEETFTISVTDVNEAPTGINLSATEIDEGKPENSIVGQFTTIDPDANENHQYAIDSTYEDGSRFLINSNNELILLDAPNSAVKATYTIRVTTTDKGGLTFTKDFTITVADLPDPPTDLALSNTSIEENVGDNFAFATITSTDPDVGDTVTYTLVENFGDNAAFTIVEQDGAFRLVINQSPNFEAKPSYSVKIRATDSNGLFTEETFTISITDVNEPPTTISLSNNQVFEDVPDNFTVGNFSNNDPDANETHTYTLVEGFGDNAAFTIAGNSLILKQSPDFDTKQTYSIQVRLTDKGGFEVIKDFTITVVDVNSAPTGLSLSNTAVDENVGNNFAIGTFTTTDPDDTEHTYSLVPGFGDNAAFTISGNTLIINQSPDFETKASYSIRVRTTDTRTGEGGGKFYEETFTITVNDLNDPPTDISLDKNNVNENVPVGTLVGNFSTVDQDNNDTFTYTLVDGAGATDNSRFILTADGTLKINVVPDFETKPSYSIRVKTTDAKGLSYEKTFTVLINNLPENPGDTDPTDLLLSNTAIDENVPAGTQIGTFSTIDPDSGDTFKYTLVSGAGSTDNGAFTLTQDGKLSINASPNFEAKSSYAIRVRTTDFGGRFIEKTFTITINNVNEPPIITLSGGTVVYTEQAPAIAIDPALQVKDDDSLTLQGATVSIGGYVAGQDRLEFTNQSGITGNFDQATGILTLTGTASLAAYQTALRSVKYFNTSNNPNTANRTIRFTATDGENTSALVSRTVQLATVNDPPIVTTSGGALSYTEGNGAISVDPLVQVADVDSPNLTGARVAIGGYVAGQDRLEFTNQSGITGNFDDATGILTLTGTAPIATYQAALRSIAYLNTSENPDTKNRILQFSVTDGAATSNIATRTVQLNGVNTPPSVVTSGGALSYQENAGALAIDAGIQVRDPDSANLTGATIVLTGYVSNQDRLNFTNRNGITGNFNAATGVLTLSGSASVTAYQQALRSITYTNSSNNPNIQARSIQVTVTDGVATSSPAFRSIQVISVNDPPVLTPSRQAIDFPRVAGAITIDSGINLSDPDHTHLTGATIALKGYVAGQDSLLFNDQNGITGSFNAATGILTLTGRASIAQYRTALRSILYANNSDAPRTNTRTAEIRVSDGISDSKLAAIQIRFNPAGVPPVLDLNGTNAGVDFSSTYVMTGPAVSIIAPSATLTDPNRTVMTSAQVVISNLIDWQHEELLVNTQGTGISATYDRRKGTLSLSGTASKAAYLKVLKSIQYRNRSSKPDMTTRTILFSVNNGTTRSEPAQTTVQLTTVNLLNQGTAGNDRLITTPATDIINAQGGNDVVVSNLENLQQNDKINGGAGMDTFALTNGIGFAVVDVDHPVNQVAGILTGSTTITNFEYFDFTGFQGSVSMIGSNRFGNRLLGGQGNDVLLGGLGNDLLVGNEGNDRLDGGLGDNTLIGGLGDDIYYVHRPNDVIVEAENGGYDIVFASVDWTLGAHLEDLALVGNAINGVGNDLNNAITGNQFNNFLVGGFGNDTLVGGGGNDVLMGGDGDDDLQGGAGRDRLFGGAGNDRLDGGRGRNILIGGAGRDIFVLSSRRKRDRSTIRDFKPGEDMLQLSRKGFNNKLKRGRMRASQFTLGSSATESSHRLIYNQSTGSLFYDSDGIGGSSQVLIAKLTNRAALTRADITVAR